MASSSGIEQLSSSHVTAIQRETAADVLSAQAKALVQARYQVAMLKPRDWDDVRQRLLRDCERPRFAEAAIYRKPIGGGTVEGLSIRFAESAIRSMTNLQPEHIVLYDDDHQRIVRISLTDIEANVSYSKDVILQKTVERRKPKQGTPVVGERVNSQGQVVFIVVATEDELATKEAAMASKVMRQHALRLLPADIQEECEERVRSTVAAKIKADPDAEKKKIIDSFEDIGIAVPEIKRFLGVDSIDRLAPRQITELRAVYQAIRDGETDWREVMAQRDSARGESENKSGESLAPPVTTVQARELKQAWDAIHGTAPDAPDQWKAFLQKQFGVTSSLKIPQSKFEAALKAIKDSAPTAPTDQPKSDAPVVAQTPDQKLAFDLFGILGYDLVKQAEAIKESAGDWSVLAKKLQAELPEEQ